MLQRAASNAYSWWWASHIRTKQTKWLDQSLQDMEEKVQEVIKLIEEDGDSFARRAEMYYKKRPELINFVQESYRAFRSLADRYDLLSKELQNANHQLATVFPEQYQMENEYDDDFTSPKPPRKFVPNANTSNLPNVPKAPIKKWKGLVSASKQLQKPKKEANKTVQKKSGLSKNEALEELDKVQKEILSLQTVKEFVKSSYQNGLQKYKGIENQISEKQHRLSSLQDEFGLNKSIEDDEARTLMAEAALKSCEETLAQLKEKQEKYHHEAKQEFKKIQDARQKLNSIKKEFLHDQTEETRFSEESKSSIEIEPQNSIDEQFGDISNDIKEIIDGDSSGSLTVTQLAEKIDKLVNKVINLETSISSQTILIDRLRTEANDLNSQIHVLEEDKPNLTDNNNTQELKIKVQKMEEKLDGIQSLNRDVETRNNNLQTHFAEARSSLDHLSEKLSNIKPDEDDETPLKVVVEQIKTESENPMQQNAKCNGQIDTTETNTMEEIKKEDPGTPVKSKTVKFDDEKSNQNQDDLRFDSETETEGEFDWKKMLLSGAGDKDKVLLKEYTTTLRNYKEAKKKLLEMEKKEKDQEFEVTIQIRELKSNLTKKEDEIQRLRQKLTLLQEKNGEDSEKNELRLPSFEKKDEEDIKLIFLDQPKVTSPIEEKLRQKIESILDDNLDFWLRFSSSYHQIEKFKTSIQDLQDEITKLNEKKKQEGNGMLDLKCDARPIYKHLKEIKTELTLWIDQSGLLRTELENRFTSLCNIQEKITNALKEGPEEDEIRFSSHQGAKLQGEIWNMKQENNKVREELQNGVDHITTLRIDIDKILEKLNEEFELSRVKNTGNRPHVPLKSFIFGTKQKKQKNSIFAYMQMQTGKKNQGVRSGLQ